MLWNWIDNIGGWLQFSVIGSEYAVSGLEIIAFVVSLSVHMIRWG